MGSTRLRRHRPARGAERAAGRGLLRVGGVGVDAEPRQAAHLRGARPHRRPRPHRGDQPQRHPRHRHRHRPTRRRRPVGLPAGAPVDAIPSWPSCRATHELAKSAVREARRPAWRDLGVQRLHWQPRVIASSYPPVPQQVSRHGSRSRPRSTTRRSSSSPPVSGSRSCHDWPPARCPPRSPGCGSPTPAPCARSQPWCARPAAPIPPPPGCSRCCSSSTPTRRVEAAQPPPDRPALRCAIDDDV